MFLDDLEKVLKVLKSDGNAYGLDLRKEAIEIVEREIALKTLNPVTGKYDAHRR